MIHIFLCRCRHQGRALMGIPAQCPRCERLRTYAGRGPAFTERDVRAERERQRRADFQKRMDEQDAQRRRWQDEYDNSTFGMF